MADFSTWRTTIRESFKKPSRDLRVAYCRLLFNAVLALSSTAVALLVQERTLSHIGGAVFLIVIASVLGLGGILFVQGEQS